MKRSESPTLPSRLKAVRQELERWRRTRRKRSPIPEALWESATELAQEHGTSKVAQALRLNYYDLKKRVDASTALTVMASSPAFVEVDAPCGFPGGGCQVALESPGGRRMSIQVRGPQAGVDVAALCEAFWREGS